MPFLPMIRAFIFWESGIQRDEIIKREIRGEAREEKDE
jgi:hypothetical protein